MTKDKFPQSRILSVAQFLRAFQSGCQNSERFCFILGSGASVDSGIPMGGTLENRWMKCLMGEEDDLDGTKAFSPEETRELAGHLKEEGKLQHDFKEIEEAWKQIKRNGKGTLPSEYYFDLYKLRFSPNHRNGYYYLENIMADKEPSFGYHTLAEMLTDGRGNNLVITTNFDSLTEDALFLYSKSKPLVINHELLADYIGNSNFKRPIIAKVHRGMFFDPLNDPEDTTGLKGKWHEVLQQAFHIYTPIVLGYGGGDHSLMDFLMDCKTEMPHGIYWCYMEKFGLPPEKIQNLVKSNQGCFVKINGFDSIMLKIGNELYPEKIGGHATEEYLKKRTNGRISRYREEMDRLMEQEKEVPTNFSAEIEYREAVDTFNDRESRAQEEWEKEEKLTVGDYVRMGIAYRRSKKYDKAINAYNQALQLNPNYERAYNNRGNVYYDLKEYEKAIQDYNKALELNPDYAAAYSNRANIYSDLKEYEKAIQDYNKSIELNPDYITALNNRGIVYKMQTQYDLALADFNRILELDPNNQPALKMQKSISEIIEGHNPQEQNP